MVSVGDHDLLSFKKNVTKHHILTKNKNDKALRRRPTNCSSIIVVVVGILTTTSLHTTKEFVKRRKDELFL